MESKLNCMSCGTTACEYTDREEPRFCAQSAVSSALHDEAQRLYALPENHVIMQAAAMVSEETANSTRAQDTIKFANLIGATHIGIASCTIMLRETRILAKLLEQAGFLQARKQPEGRPRPRAPGKGRRRRCRLQSHHAGASPQRSEDGPEHPHGHMRGT